MRSRSTKNMKFSLTIILELSAIGNKESSDGYNEKLHTVKDSKKLPIEAK